MCVCACVAMLFGAAVHVGLHCSASVCAVHVSLQCMCNACVFAMHVCCFAEHMCLQCMLFVAVHVCCHSCLENSLSVQCLQHFWMSLCSWFAVMVPMSEENGESSDGGESNSTIQYVSQRGTVIDGQPFNWKWNGGH